MRFVPLLLLGTVLCAQPKERRFSFEYKAQVPSSAGARNVQLWVPIPHDDAWQKIVNLKIESSSPYQLETDALGNRILSVSSAQSPSVTIRFDCIRQEHIQSTEPVPGAPSLTASERARWMAPDKMVPLDDTIQKWALEVVTAAQAKTDVEMARAIYNHVVATVKYDKTGKGWGRGDIYYACDARRGNCTDFHAIFIGYARAMGIPARFSIGFPLPAERGRGAVVGYHCWAEFYAAGIGWVPIDASEAGKDPSRRSYFFGAHDENRVEFSRGRDLVLNPPQSGPPLNYFVYPYAEVDGKPVENVERSVSWKDVTPKDQTAAPPGYAGNK